MRIWKDLHRYITTTYGLYTYDNFTNYNALVYAVNCIGYIASYDDWALLCLHYATTLLQKFQCMNVLSCTYISHSKYNNKIMLNALLKYIKLLIVNIAF